MRKKIILIALIVLSAFVLTSCFQYKEEKDALSKEAVEATIEYMYKKYGEKITKKSITSIGMDQGYSVFPVPPYGRADVNLSDGTIVYYNAQDKTIKDDRGIPQLKEDFLDYIKENAITNEYTVDYFVVGQYYLGYGYGDKFPEPEGLGLDLKYDGNIKKFLSSTDDLNIELRVFWKAEDDYKDYNRENEAFVKLIEKSFTEAEATVTSVVLIGASYDGNIMEKEGRNFINDLSHIYSFVHTISYYESQMEYPQEYYEQENSTLKPERKYYERFNNFIELEPGMEVASQVENLALRDKSQLDYKVFKMLDIDYPEVQDILKLYILEGVDASAKIAQLKLYKATSTEMQDDSNIYIISFNKEIIEEFDMNWNRGPVIRIDKNVFQDGILKGEATIGLINFYDAKIGLAEARHCTDYYEDDNILYFQKENRQLLTIINPFPPLEKAEPLVPQEPKEPLN